jgi:hypothetical protein
LAPETKLVRWKACAIRLRAEKKAGRLTKQMEKNRGGRPSKTLPPGGRVSTKAEQLEDAGITPKQAEMWEQLGDVPNDEFEGALADPNPQADHEGDHQIRQTPQGAPCASPGAVAVGPAAGFRAHGRGDSGRSGRRCPTIVRRGAARAFMGSVMVSTRSPGAHAEKPGAGQSIDRVDIRTLRANHPAIAKACNGTHKQEFGPK